jgi:hypothetical protein
MSMFVWADGTVTGSVDVVELEAIQKGLKGIGKKQLADLPWPIESGEQLVNLLADAEAAEAKTTKAEAKATTTKEK